jgi:hypothetical protein
MGMSGDRALGWVGPRAAGHEEAYEQLLGDIAEGVRLHYGEQDGDRDLSLLRGDMLYARGLATLAELGDIEATAELADVISLVAQANAASDPELADAVWEAGAVAVGWGADAEYEAAKELARAQAPGAARALIDSACRARKRAEGVASTARGASSPTA